MAINQNSSKNEITQQFHEMELYNVKLIKYELIHAEYVESERRIRYEVERCAAREAGRKITEKHARNLASHIARESSYEAAYEAARSVREVRIARGERRVARKNKRKATHIAAFETSRQELIDAHEAALKSVIVTALAMRKPPSCNSREARYNYTLENSKRENRKCETCNCDIY
jgi:hypothetical protein